jgi:methylmalonyl-CoA carboxyltransferase large subunit
MAKKKDDFQAILEEIRSQLADLTARVAKLEGPVETPAPAAVAAQAPAAPAPEPVPAPKPELSEDVLMAISAAIAAFLGVRVRIRQIRLISSPAWAQQGRVSIQASHRLF